MSHLFILLSSILHTSALTHQFPTSKLNFGYSQLVSYQAPLEQLLVKEGKPLGKRRVDFSTANHLGYTSAWTIREGVLYLEQFDAKFEGKKTALGDVLERKIELPCRADWFSGVIHCPVGEEKELHGEFDVIVRLTIEKGKLVKVESTPGTLDFTPDGTNAAK